RAGRDRRRGPQAHAAGVRRLPRRGREGEGRQRERAGGDAELGRCRMVHQQAGSAGIADHHRVQGAGRDQYRRPVAGAGRPDAPFVPEEDGKRGPIQEILSLKDKGHLVAYVGDVVGTGSSRKSATNSVLWWTGEDIPYIPNKRFGGVCLGSKIAPIFYNTME